MKSSFAVVAIAVLVAAAQADTAKNSGNAIGQVVNLLQGLMAKGKAFKLQEKKAFAETTVFCGRTRQDTTKSIADGADSMLQQKADMDKANSDVDVLAEEISDTQADQVKVEAQQSTATKLRKKENDDYKKTHKDFSDSITAIEGATKVIKAKNGDKAQSLLQIQQSELIPAEAKSAITSFIALSDSEAGPPKPNAYEGQSGGIIAILEKLRLKIQDQKTTLEKEEASSRSNFELLNQRLTDQIRDAKATISDKTAAKTKKQGQAATSEQDLATTTKGKATDEKALSDLNVDCDAKSLEYDKNQNVRAEEIKAMEVAVGILGSDSVSGAADKHKVLLDTTAPALAQLRSGSEYADKRRNLVTFLRSRAQKLGSKYLALVAARAVSDPFGKVKQMIKDLIVKLLEEANAEADQKGYCDSELATNKQTRDSKTNDIEELTATIEKGTADLSQMRQDIASLSDAITKARKSMADAQTIRDEEKATNTETVEDAKGAQVAVERATQVLKDFYGKNADASFVQESESDNVADDMAAVTAAPYKGMQSSKGGIVGLLQTVLSDFARLESETSSSEDEAASLHEKFMNDTEQDVAVKGVEVDHLENKAENTDESIRNNKKELKATQGELDAALAYYEKLRPDCVDTGLSYKDRVEMRQAEIESLQEAIKTLSN